MAVIMMMLEIAHDGGDDNAGDHDDNFVDELMMNMTNTSSSPVSGLKK